MKVIMQDLGSSNVLFGVTGGIACYKAVFFVRELVRRGAQVKVVMSASAEKFITPMTFQALTGHEVRTELFDAQAEKAMGHIELARWADFLIIAPASANCMAKLAQGLAGDLLSTLYLVNESPVLICPAMNRSMWAHPATQRNYQQLQADGVIFVGPESGEQACGETGLGRLIEFPAFFEALNQVINTKAGPVSQALAPYRVVITAGPTREPLDPVRYLTNKSSGKMGYALAVAAQQAGAQVVLVSGPTNLVPPSKVEQINVETAEEMLKAVEQNIRKNTIFIGCAAVADFRMEKISSHKLKKGQSLTLKLTPNPDILALVSKSMGAKYVVGFAAETQDVISNARQKLEKKNVDMIIANQVGSNLAFNQDENAVTILTHTQQIVLPLAQKSYLAAQIVEIIAANLDNVATSLLGK
jgi:phosphopantothenoylcysteine decarboxylase/phosphopantothenate--cysteine ligase